MQSHEVKRETTHTPKEVTKRRFQIEKLEERIAPHHRAGHYPQGQGDCYYSGPPGQCKCHPKGCRI